jgi:hypothetical protein
MILGFSLAIVCIRARTGGALVMRKDPVSTRKRGPRGGLSGTQTKEPQAIPRDLAGRWIAWSGDGLRIIGSATTLKEAQAVALAAGDPDAIFERASGVLRR